MECEIFRILSKHVSDHLSVFFQFTWLYLWIPKDFLVERFSVLADVKYILLYILQCIFKVKLSLSSLKNIYSLVSNNRHPHPLAWVNFFKFCYSVSGKSRYVRYYLCVMFCLCMKKNGIFLISVWFLLPSYF